MKVNKESSCNQYLKRNIKVGDIKFGLENDEFDIYYQPKVDKDKKIVGVEALSRWFSSIHGEVPPDIFIPIMEKYNLIYQYQNKFLFQACKQIQFLNNSLNTKIKLAVNISPILIKEDNFIDDIKKVIKDSKVDKNLIEFEITEDYPINNIKEIDKKINVLKMMNIRVYLDDFGKGYNSIHYLKEFNFDGVKIDKSYIEFIQEKPKFIYGMIQMIKAMGSKVVSEGVEKSVQVDLLDICGCDYMQGYYFYKPLSFQNLYNILKKEESIL